MGENESQREGLLCTECGWPRVARKPALWAGPWVFAALVTFTLIIVGVVTGKSYTYSSGGPMAAFAAPAVTALEATAVARGDGPDVDARTAAIVDALLAKSLPLDDLAPGPVTLLLAFGAPEASFSEGWSFGWPTVWVSGGATRVYADAMTRTGEVAAATDPTRAPLGRNQWEPDVSRTPPRSLFDFHNMTLVIRPAPEQTKGVLREWRVRLLGLSVAVAMLIGVWLIASAVARRGRASGDPGRVRRVCVMSTLAALVALIGLGALTCRGGSQVGHPMWANSVQRGVPPGPVYWASEGSWNWGSRVRR